MLSDPPSETVSDLARRRAALEADHPTWEARTIAQRFDLAAARHPDRPYVLTDERAHRYDELARLSRTVAANLIDRGLAAGEHVALVLPNGVELVLLQLAIARAGGVVVPVNPLLHVDELGYVLGQSDAAMLVVCPAFRDVDHLASVDHLAPGWETGGGGAALPALREVFVQPGPETSGGPCGATPRKPHHRLDELMRPASREALAEVARREAAADPQATAAILYTSGTSGRPKGAMLTHDALLRSAYGSAWTRGFGDGRRILFALPLHHVFAYVEGMLASLFVGGAIIPQERFDPVTTLQAIARHRADEALFVPTMTIAVLEAAAGRDEDLTSLRAVMSAAAPAPVRLWRQVIEELGVSEIVTGYGMTETAAATTYTQPDGPLELVAGTVGRAKFGGVAGDPALDGHLVAYRTIDPLTGAPLPDGAEGELVARGPILTHGYYGKPEETAAAFTTDGWLRSGDLGRIDADGSLRLTGRSKELYKCGGELVAPKEVEECLTGHPGVAQAYLVGLPDARMGEVGCAWIVPAASEPPDADELVAWCRERLARYKVPARVIFLPAEELPTTATGKVQKYRLIERARALAPGG